MNWPCEAYKLSLSGQRDRDWVLVYLSDSCISSMRRDFRADLIRYRMLLRRPGLISLLHIYQQLDERCSIYTEDDLIRSHTLRLT
jgi:hypothetical protein